jgi:hypothetical protein
MYTDSQLSEFPPVVQDMIQAHGLPVVARDAVPAATCGLIKSGRTLANLDSLGEGPEVRIRHGRGIGYPTLDFFRWFSRRVVVEPGKKPATLEA